MTNEKRIFLLLAGVFLFFFFMPLGSDTFVNALLSGFELLHEYAREHVLLCLLPAFFIAGAITTFVKKEAILRYLGGGAKKYVSYSISSVSGAVLAVCSCTILPLFAGIRKRGAGLGPATTFLFSGPAINIAAIFLTFSVLGVKIGIARIIGAVVLSILVGLTMQLIFREKSQGEELSTQAYNDKGPRKSILAIFFLFLLGILVIDSLEMGEIIKYALLTVFILVVAGIAFFKFQREYTEEWLRETWGFTKKLLPILFIGIFIAGFVMTLIPENLVSSFVGDNSLQGNLLASVFGMFMYFSTLTEIPILHELIGMGMHRGPALALLLAGPSVSLPNMLVIRSVLGNKKTMVYILLVVFYSTLAGLIFGFGL